MGAKTIGNIGNAAFLSTAGVILTPFVKMDSIDVLFDGTLTPVYGGSSMLPSWHISADRKPKASVKGPEVPLDSYDQLFGFNKTIAASGTPTVMPWLDYATIDASGKITLDYPLSATNLSVSIVGGGKEYTGVASAPTTGQFVTPIASATQITFAAADAGKNVMISYHTDTTTGGQLDYMPTSKSVPGKLIGTALLLDSEGGPDLPISWQVNLCRFDGTWTMSNQRMKPVATDIELSVLDPGGSTPAISMYVQATFM
jgi:hypothetical protein